jgi:tRNA dimethylallyltransferase
MWRGGLLEETRYLMDLDVPRHASIWGAIGYAEAAAHLEGRQDAEAAQERIFRRTRQYAKRQWTWFRHHHGTRWFDRGSEPGWGAALGDLERALVVP